MNGKRFFIGALAVCALLLAVTAGLVAYADPLLTVGALEPGETALFVNERYEMAGLIRRQEYSNLVMGTSMAANFRSSWFTDRLGTDTLKISFPDGRLSEFDIALDLAFRTHDSIDRVYFGLDPNILVRNDQSVELPEYLYNDSPLDDFQFYLNAESLVLAAKSLLLGEEGKTTLDEAYVWDNTHVFSRAVALESYPRPEAVNAALASDAYLPAARANVDVVCGWAERYPDTRFVVWFPPYSVLFWDQAARQGRTEALLNAIEYAWGRLLAQDNVVVISFLNSQGIIDNLNNYTDHIHCSASVTAWMTNKLAAEQWRIWPEAYQGQLDELRQFVTAYDYDGIFEENG